SAKLDTTAPGEGVDDDSDPDNDINSIAFIDDNNVLNEDELKAVDIEGQVEADGTINSIVISGVDEDGKPVSYALKESEYRVDDNGKVTITDLNLSGVGFVDGNLTVTMSVTDKAGNAGSVNDSINLDTTAPGDGEGEDGADLGPIVHIVDDVNNDGLINEAELGQDNVQITVTVNHEELLNGGHVTLQVGEREVSLKLDDGKLVNLDGSEQNTYEYKEGVISWTETAPAEGGTITVTATQTDKAGNESAEGKDSAKLDTTAPGEGVDDDSDPDNDINSIAFIDDNNVLSEDELKSVDIEGQVEADGTINSIVISGVDEDGKPVSYALKESEYRVDDNGKVTITDLDLSGVGFADGNLTVTMSVTDKAGNAGSVNDTINLDTTAPGDGEDGADLGPIVHIVDDVNNDGLINEAELGQDNVQITVTVNHEELLNGGHLTL
ncbi:Ig-like domain repeat protein, partial [Vibrio rotiferianus]